MKNILCQSLKHTGLWSIAPQPVLAAFMGTEPSIRGSYNDRMPGDFIAGDGYK